MVSGMISYHETHAFFDTHYAEIEELRHEYEDNTGSTLAIPNDLKNTLVWFAFEYIAYLIAEKWNLA